MYNIPQKITVLKEFKENLEINHIYRLEDNTLRMSDSSNFSQIICTFKTIPSKIPKVCICICMCIWQIDSTVYMEMQRWGIAKTLEEEQQDERTPDIKTIFF